MIIFGHSPPGKYERSFQVSKGAASSSSISSQHWLQERFNHKYLEFVRKYSDIIVGQFFGHQHSDSFRIFRNEKGTCFILILFYALFRLQREKGILKCCKWGWVFGNKIFIPANREFPGNFDHSREIPGNGKTYLKV